MNIFRSFFDYLDQLARHQMRPVAAFQVIGLRMLRDRTGLLIGSAFAVAFGLIYGILTGRPLFCFLIALLFSASITYTSPICYYIRLAGKRRASSPYLLMVNGTLALICGGLSFYGSILLASLLLMGWEITRINASEYLPYSINGVLYAIIGLLIALGSEMERQGRRAEAREQRFQRLAEEARLVALRSQMNPHFFFNALNTIAALIPTRPEDAERAVELLAKALRPILIQEQPLLGTLDSELQIVRAYTELEKLRFGGRFRVSYNIDEDIRETPLPSLSLQPLVENAIVHGAARTTDPFSVALSAYRTESGVLVEIKSAPDGQSETDKIYTPVASRKGHALHNLKQRLRMLFGTTGDLTVSANGAGAALVQLRLPVEIPPKRLDRIGKLKETTS